MAVATSVLPLQMVTGSAMATSVLPLQMVTGHAVAYLKGWSSLSGAHYSYHLAGIHHLSQGLKMHASFDSITWYLVASCGRRPLQGLRSDLL